MPSNIAIRMLPMYRTSDARASPVTARFPLPYHHNAYFVAMADHWLGSVDSKGGSRYSTSGGSGGAGLLFPFAATVFDAQASLLDGAANMTEPQARRPPLSPTPFLSPPLATPTSPPTPSLPLRCPAHSSTPSFPPRHPASLLYLQSPATLPPCIGLSWATFYNFKIPTTLRLRPHALHLRGPVGCTTAT